MKSKLKSFIDQYIKENMEAFGVFYENKNYMKFWYFDGKTGEYNFINHGEM